VPVAWARSATCEITLDDKRFVVVASPARYVRDNRRREEFMARTEDKLIALSERLSSGQLVDPAKIGAAADRILRDSGVARCFTASIRQKSFTWDYDKEALDYEVNDVAGRYVLTTSLTKDQASTADVVRHYRTLEQVEHRFRVMKDFLSSRAVFHYTEERVCGHIALWVIAAVIEALITIELHVAGVMDPNIDGQMLSARRALAELAHQDEPDHRGRARGGRGHAPQRPPVTSPCSPRRRHLELGQGHNRLTWEFPNCVGGNTLLSRLHLPGVSRFTRQSRV
jgi:hypothetical protein